MQGFVIDIITTFGYIYIYLNTYVYIQCVISTNGEMCNYFQLVLVTFALLLILVSSKH